jgi:hypothetical protein
MYQFKANLKATGEGGILSRKNFLIEGSLSHLK